jgi:putative ABC transport system ATP-binding protein
MQHPELLRFENVTVTSRNNTLLENVSFSVKEAEKIVLMGKSGAGKSTLLKTIVGGYSITRGSISFRGRSILPDNIYQVRSLIAFVDQEPILGAERVKDALLLPFRFKAHKKDFPSAQRIDEVLSSLNLSQQILPQLSFEISGGEKQRIVIGRAILLNKTIFLLDEITSALDPESKMAVKTLFSNSHYTVISISHDPEWISCCRRIITLDNGQILRDQTNGNY